MGPLLALGLLFFAIFATGLRFERRGEKPFRKDPNIWTSDPAETERRYQTALEEWRQRA